jgi:hypothetical protein
MTSENKMWDNLKAEYLRQVERALSSVKHPRGKEVLEDVRSHLDRRFAELKPGQQTWENFRAIITEMGPASDYAELLGQDVILAKRNVYTRYLLWVVLVLILLVTAILLPMAASGKSKEHKYLTISKAYWFHSNDRPIWIPDDAVPKDNDGHILFHIDEWFEDISTSAQYRPFLNKVDKRFVLKVDGYPDVHANAERGAWNQEFYIRIPEKEHVKMEAGVMYTVYPVNSNPKYQWKVAPGVTICKSNE